jgi:hypothetical protein
MPLTLPMQKNEVEEILILIKSGNQEAPSMKVLPQEVLERPVNYREQKIHSPLEYVIAFYGVSKNGQTGERAPCFTICFLLNRADKIDSPFQHFIITYFHQTPTRTEWGEMAIIADPEGRKIELYKK